MSDDSSSVTPGSSPASVYSPRLDGPPERKLREKLLNGRRSAVSTTDLVSLVVGSREKGRQLVREHAVADLAELSVEAWRHRTGMNQADLARICAVFELGRRAYSTDAGDERPKLTRPSDVFAQVRRIGRLRKEHLIGLYLDAQNGLLHEETLSVGSLNTTRTHPREIMYPAIEHLALGFVLAHNHPSGSIEPSPEDIEFTGAVRRAGELMGIELYDHLVVARDGFTSMRERGLL